MSDREILTGETVEEQGRNDLAEVRANLDEHYRIRTGLPVRPIIKDVDLIPPVSAIGSQDIELGSADLDVASEKITPIQVHTRNVREALIVANGLGDSEGFREIKKKAA